MNQNTRSLNLEIERLMKRLRFMRRPSAGVADDVSSTLLLLKRRRTVVVTTTYSSPVWAIVPASPNTRTSRSSC